jgi:N-acylneuraminate cytidylyltransferase
MSAVAIITARGGSKRIPRKNIRPFLGRPIIAYSIEAALGSELFDEVMVSTDDDEIAAIAREHGAEVPFRRSAQMSDDRATTAEVLNEVLGQYRERGRTFDNACCIYPTAPFVTAERLRKAFERLEEIGADTVIPVARFSFPIWRAFQMNEGRLSYIWPENAPKRSQDLPAAFHDAGQFYFFRTEPFLTSGQLVGVNTVGLETDELEVQDIDNEQDWRLAELKYRLMIERQEP